MGLNYGNYKTKFTIDNNDIYFQFWKNINFTKEEQKNIKHSVKINQYRSAFQMLDEHTKKDVLLASYSDIQKFINNKFIGTTAKNKTNFIRAVVKCYLNNNKQLIIKTDKTLVIFSFNLTDEIIQVVNELGKTC